jgi:Fe-S cluster assembly protein SufD
MMAQQSDQEQDSFQMLLSQQYDQLNPNDTLQKLRTKAWNHFLELGLPNRKTEVFRYIRLRNLFDRQLIPANACKIDFKIIAPFILPECSQSALVFVNGHYAPHLSRLEGLPKRMVVSPLAEAMKTYSTFLNNQWSRSLKDETDPFATLNAALHPAGVFIYIPPKTVLSSPLQILHILETGDTPMLAMPRINLFAGSQAEAIIYSTQAVLSGSRYCINLAADFAIEDDAHVHYFQLVFQEPKEAWHFDALRAYLKRDSTLETVSATDGGLTIRYDYRVVLGGENGEALLNGVWMLKDKREAHTHVIIDHQAPHCRSMQLYKGVLSDFSHSSFEGKILVRQPAQKTDAFQLNNNLLLSDRATANSKPNLEIFADDVKASHGATVGQLDKEQLFYMKTRGFPLSKAKDLLINAFCREVLDKIPHPSLHQKLCNYAERFFSKES